MNSSAEDRDRSVRAPAGSGAAQARPRHDAGVGELLRLGVAALVLGLMAVAFNIAVAAIIYQGPLAAFLDRAIALALASGIIMGVAGAVLLSYRGTICQPQNTIAVILSLSAGAVATSMADPTSEATFATVAAFVGATTAGTGAIAWLLGTLRLGSVARFIPFPVLTGFLAATGYLLIMGSLGMALGQPVNVRNLSTLVEPGNAVKWLPWALAAAVIVAVTRRTGKPMVLPIGLFLSGVAFYVALVALDVSLDDAGRNDLLLGPFGGAGFLQALRGWQPFAVEGRALITHLPSGLAAVGLCVVSAVMAASSLEVAVRCHIDPDRDLRGVGIANLAAPFGGGGVGYHSLSLTLLAYELGIRDAKGGWTVVIACLLALTVGAPLIAILPIGLFAAGVMVIGANLLLGPLIDQRRNLPAQEYFVVAVIPAVTAFFGFLPGVGVGLLAAALFFVTTFARIDVVRIATTGARLRSRLERADSEHARLTRLGRLSAIYSLGGYIFFGTAYRLAERIETALHRTPPHRFVVIDFRRVSGLDTSAARALGRLVDACRRRDVGLYLAGLNEPSARLIRAQVSADPPGVSFVARLDDALEEVERQLLAAEPMPATDEFGLFQNLLQRHPAADLESYFRIVTAPAGAEVIAQGAPSDSLLVLRSGALRTELSVEDGPPVTIARCLPGALIGEIGLYAGVRRTARVVAETPSEFLQIDTTALERMALEQPALMADFHRMIAATLARRLGRTTALLADAELLGS